MMKRLALVTISSVLALLATAAESADVVTTRGLGPAHFGMTVAQFSRALGEPMTTPADPDEQGCFYLVSKRFGDVHFMFEGGKLRRIDVQTDKIATEDGVRVGATVGQVKQRYGARLADEPHHYSGPEDRYLTLRMNHGMAVRFETSNDKIDNFYVGYRAQVQYVEGCL